MTEFCEQQAIQHPTLSDKYSQLSELFSRKLWHQLTVAVYDFVQDDANSQGDSFIRLYTDFIAKFEARINQLKLAQILCAVARKFADPADAAALLSSALEKSARLGPEPSLLLSSELGLTNLRRGMAEGVKEQLAKDKAALEDLEGVADTSVHSAHHLLACEYYKGVGPPEAFFRSALMYLAYTPLESMPAERQQQLATDIRYACCIGSDPVEHSTLQVWGIFATCTWRTHRWRLRPQSGSSSWRPISGDHALLEVMGSRPMQ
eukprot:TRINITY_DN5464_c0_g1_i2.p1 TRINITY_DN5464_c0_g1~~TRINITY_DN5464_c0_g1_i2.p1  ORF type:complete len:263 (-),score=75.93 TRINITY_DN5464_c0_g1_i2:1693-2481(-)